MVKGQHTIPLGPGWSLFDVLVLVPNHNALTLKDIQHDCIAVYKNICKHFLRSILLLQKFHKYAHDKYSTGII